MPHLPGNVRSPVTPAEPSARRPSPERLAELVGLASLFGRLGLIGFGGPAAHIALMRREVVERRGWLDDRRFMELVAAVHLIPGPNSTELAMHIGRDRAGIAGLVVAGSAFILPAFALVLGAAMAYRRFGTTPDAAWILAGVTPVIVAIVGDALWRLTASVVRRAQDAATAIAAALAALAGVHELLVLAAAAGLALVWAVGDHRRGVGSAGIVALLGSCGDALHAAAATGTPPARTAIRAAFVAAPAVAVAHGGPPTLVGLALFFLKVGAVLFGSGYVLIAFIEADLVQRWGWLTTQQLVDAVAVGQFTPGPLFTTATFIGYVLQGPIGAVVATAAIFAPGFVFVACTAPLLARLRESATLSTLLQGLTLASLGLMAAVSVSLAGATLVSPARIVIAAAALVLLLWKAPNSAWLVLAGAVVGWIGRP